MYSPSDYFWWRQPTENQHKHIFGLVKHLELYQSYRTDENLRYMRLYGNLEPYNLRNYNFYRAEPIFNTQNRITLNIVQSMVDTVVSKITKNRPKPTFLTEGGDWSLQRKAQKLTQFAEGQFQATDFYAEAALAFKDAGIFGTGAVKIYREGLEIRSERVFIDELIVDDSEALYGHPRSLFQRKWIHKDVLKAWFPEHEAIIEHLGSTEMSAWASNTYDRATNMVLVIEAWHLPSSKDAVDGRHVICIQNVCLFDEPWTKKYYPFIFWRWSVRPIGFWGMGLTEQLMGPQLEINKILRTIQISMHLVSVPKILVEANSKIVSAHLNNKVGGIIKYVGTPPSYQVLGQIPPDLFQHLDRIYQRAYEIAGISQMSANSAKPAGLNSGKALREYNDLETERFMDVAQRYEKAFLDAAKQMVDLAKEIAEEEPNYSVKVKGSKFFDTIKWKDVSLDEDKYLMQVFPSSALSSTPAGKLQDVQDLLQAGFISKEDGMKLLDFPDLRSFYNFNNAGVEDIERAIELIIEDNNYQAPEPYQNLQLGITKMQQAYLYYRANGAPEEKLELFRRWIEAAGVLLQKATQPQATPAPQAAPEAAAAQASAGPGPEAAPVPGNVSPIQAAQ